MKQRSVLINLIILFLAACFPIKPLQSVTGDEAIRRITSRFPSLPITKIVTPSDLQIETKGDMTVRISLVYITENVMIIGVTAHNSSGKRFFPVIASLTYATGAPFKYDFSTGLSGSSDNLGISLPPDEQVDVIFFKEPNSPKISLPFDGILTLPYDERSL